jgi:hypothetical protein
VLPGVELGAAPVEARPQRVDGVVAEREPERRLGLVEHGTSPQSLLALVAAGVGVTRLAVSARSLRDGGVTFVPLAGEEAVVVLVWRSDAANPALAALRAVVREVASELAG